MPITGTIEHKDLPDNLLHEPKGASTATAGQVYVADGNASGSFQSLPLTDVVFTRDPVTPITPASITGTVSLDGSTLSQLPDGHLTDVAATLGVPQTITNKINENASELYRLYNNQLQINTDLTNALSAVEGKLNALINALQNAGVITNA